MESSCPEKGNNALFLCVLNGEAYLLRYNPTMYQDAGTYNYQLFSLENLQVFRRAQQGENIAQPTLDQRG